MKAVLLLAWLHACAAVWISTEHLALATEFADQFDYFSIQSEGLYLCKIGDVACTSVGHLCSPYVGVDCWEPFITEVAELSRLLVEHSSERWWAWNSGAYKDTMRAGVVYLRQKWDSLAICQNRPGADPAAVVCSHLIDISWRVASNDRLPWRSIDGIAIALAPNGTVAFTEGFAGDCALVGSPGCPTRDPYNGKCCVVATNNPDGSLRKPK